MFGKVGVRGVDPAQFDRLRFYFDDAVDIVHFLWVVVIPVRLEVVGENLNTLVCKVFYCFSKVPDIFVEKVIFFAIDLLLWFLKSMVNSVIWPKINKHNSVWLVLTDEIKHEVVVILPFR